MPTDADFLRAIVADPDADAPRLAYADWREECGDAARAEFIRVQCALAALPEGERTYHPLRERAEKLLEAHRAKWVQPLRSLWQARRWPRWLGGPSESASDEWFGRGFVEGLAIDLDLYLAHAAAIAAQIPLRELWASLGGFEHADLIDRFSQCPETATLTTLGLTFNHLSPLDIHRLDNSPQLNGLQTLSLNGIIDDTAVQSLTTSHLLRRLNRLEVVGVGALTDADASPFLREESCRGLRELALRGVALLEEEFCHQPLLNRFDRLEYLDLSHNPLGAGSVSSLIDVTPPRLKDLILAQTGLDDRPAAAFAVWPKLRQLRSLSLSGNGITDIGAMMLADSPNLLASTRLDLTNNRISKRVQNALRIRLGHHVVV